MYSFFGGASESTLKLHLEENKRTVTFVDLFLTDIVYLLWCAGKRFSKNASYPHVGIFTVIFP